METDEVAGSKAENKEQVAGQVLSSFPPSLVPRLHCIRAKHLKHNNSLLYKQNSGIDTKDAAYWSRQHAQFLASLSEDGKELQLLTLRNEILACFQEMLLGDALAAEYLLMHLLSRV